MPQTVCTRLYFFEQPRLPQLPQNLHTYIDIKENYTYIEYLIIMLFDIYRWKSAWSGVFYDAIDGGAVVVYNAMVLFADSEG